jgi:type IV pilus assembly protein PilV
MAKQHTLERSQGGFSLIEVLVTYVILAIGLLGLAGFQLRAHQAEFEAYNRAQALILLEAMVNRLNANRWTAPCYAVTTGNGSPYLGAVDGGHSGAVDCAGFGDANTQLRAINDLNEWDVALQGAAELINGASRGGSLGARGCITFDAATSTYTIAVAWQGLVDTVTPATACGNGFYGQETRRRVVATTVRMATLL